MMMVGALGLSGLGESVSRTATVSLSIPALSVLSLLDRAISGREVVVEIGAEDLARGFLLIPLEVKSNVPWAVTAQVLGAWAELSLAVLGGPEVTLATEEVTLLSGRPGKHELSLLLKLSPEKVREGAKLVLRVAGGFGQGPASG